MLSSMQTPRRVMFSPSGVGAVSSTTWTRTARSRFPGANGVSFTSDHRNGGWIVISPEIVE